MQIGVGLKFAYANDARAGVPAFLAIATSCARLLLSAGEPATLSQDSCSLGNRYLSSLFLSSCQ